MILMKNHETRSTRAAPLPESNVVKHVINLKTKEIIIGAMIMHRNVTKIRDIATVVEVMVIIKGSSLKITPEKVIVIVVA